MDYSLRRAFSFHIHHKSIANRFHFSPLNGRSGLPLSEIRYVIWYIGLHIWSVDTAALPSGQKLDPEGSQHLEQDARERFNRWFHRNSLLALGSQGTRPRPYESCFISSPHSNREDSSSNNSEQDPTWCLFS